MDGCDGAIARLTHRSSSFGAFFDSVMDRISEFIIFLALFIYFWELVLWNIIEMRIIIFFSFLGSIMISYARARAENFFKNSKEEADLDIGLMARSERLFYLFITSIISFFYGFFSEFLFLFMCLVILTALYRSIKIYIQIKKIEP